MTNPTSIKTNLDSTANPTTPRQPKGRLHEIATALKEEEDLINGILTETDKMPSGDRVTIFFEELEKSKLK